MRTFNWRSLNSKILLPLLITALLSILITGLVGYNSAKHGLQKEVFNQLEGIRNIQAQNITNDFKKTLNVVLTLSENELTINGIRDFKAAVAKLPNLDISPEEHTKLYEYYQNEFIPRLAKNSQTQ